jgi:membrane protease YdiL (CAAX protease family)
MSSADAALWRMLGVQVFFGGLAVLLALGRGGSQRDRLGHARGGLAAAPLALGVLGTLALSGALQFAVETLALTPGTSLERLNELATQAAPTSPALTLLAFGLLPAFCEELLCRGAVQRSLAHAIGAWCIPAAAAVFAALHMDPVHTPAAFLLGAYLGALAWLAQTTWLPIACHLVNNGAATVQQLLPDAALALPRPESWVDAVIWLAISGASLAGAARSARSRAIPRSPASA